MKRRLVVWGASGHALVVADIVRLGEQYEIVGFLDDFTPDLYGTLFCGVTLLGGQAHLDHLRAQGVEWLVFGFGDCAARLRFTPLVRAKGFQLATLVHPRAVVARDVPIGAGTVIAAGAVVNPGASLGENVIVNTSASVDHECVIEDGVHICPGVRLAGRVHVGRGSWVGIGTTVSDRLRIGSHTMVGAGSLVLNDIPDGVVAYGVPARVVKKQ